MFKHFIAIYSSFSDGKRFAWHYSSEQFDNSIIIAFLDKVRKKYPDIHLGTHRLTTDTPDWKSVKDADEFFKDILVIENSENFFSILEMDRELSVLDVAKFILSIKSVTPLKLQKLVYISYEKFIKLTGVKLFPETIYAWKHGPVVEELYHAYKSAGSNTISNNEDEDNSSTFKISEVAVPSTFMRIFASEHGEIALSVILDTLVEYGEKGAWELVDITHQEGTPWSRVYSPGANKVISDDLIIAKGIH